MGNHRQKMIEFFGFKRADSIAIYRLLKLRHSTHLTPAGQKHFFVSHQLK
jgi:hypothetical protein